MAQHRTLRTAGRTGRVAEHRDVVLADQRRLKQGRRTRHGLVVRHRPGRWAGRLSRPCTEVERQRRDGRTQSHGLIGELLARDQGYCLGVLEDVLHLVDRQPEVDRHGARANPVTRQQRLDELKPVVQHERHPVAGNHPVVGEHLRQHERARSVQCSSSIHVLSSADECGHGVASTSGVEEEKKCRFELKSYHIMTRVLRCLALVLPARHDEPRGDRGLLRPPAADGSRAAAGARGLEPAARRPPTRDAGASLRLGGGGVRRAQAGTGSR